MRSNPADSEVRLSGHTPKACKLVGWSLPQHLDSAGTAEISRHGQPHRASAARPKIMVNP